MPDLIVHNLSRISRQGAPAGRRACMCERRGMTDAHHTPYDASILHARKR